VSGVSILRDSVVNLVGQLDGITITGIYICSARRPESIHRLQHPLSDVKLHQQQRADHEGQICQLATATTMTSDRCITDHSKHVATEEWAAAPLCPPPQTNTILAAIVDGY